MFQLSLFTFLIFISLVLSVPKNSILKNLAEKLYNNPLVKISMALYYIWWVVIIFAGTFIYLGVIEY